MRVSNFSVLVHPGNERDSGHVEVSHGEVYTIKLGNHEHRRCDAEVVVDGKSVGNFRLNAFGSIILERPAHDTGKFTFYKSNSREAEAANKDGVAKDDRGLVQVKFRPEKIEAYRKREEKTSGIRGQSMGFAGEEGITGLSGRSDQQFTSVACLDYDESAKVTISLRLVCGGVVRELTPAARGNAVPAAV